MVKKQYRVLGTLTYPTDPKVIKRIQAGEVVPMEERGPVKTVGPGKIEDDIPAVSVPWLLEQGYIEVVVEEELGS
ncbi:MAG: hypothetical protein HW375_41 [Anaerolineales bacterium]|nr:hypothetical protein [Anaerolineales bacterium]